MVDYNWQEETRKWIKRKKSIEGYEDELIEFFIKVFENTNYPEKSFFGTLNSSITLTIGGLYLAAYNHNTEYGIWLLLDRAFEQKEGLIFSPVKSTKNSRVKLTWLNIPQLENLNKILSDKDIWDSYKEASQLVIFTPLGSFERKDRKKNKILLSDFYDKSNIFFPDEIIETEKIYVEGTVKLITVNFYERDEKARRECIRFHGISCKVCDLNFEEKYGELGKDFIHVHHIKPISEIKKEYIIDPKKDLIPVCPNCHAMLHRKKEVLSIDALKKIIKP